jgi:small subunit ribosomal protein S8
MSISDSVADALTMLRNANSAKKEIVDIPRSKIILEIVRLMKKEGFIGNYKPIEDKKQGVLRVYLKCGKSGRSVLTSLRRISKPGLRVYVNKENIPTVLGGLGISILSTPRGILTGKEAKDLNVGGEVLCYVW